MTELLEKRIIRLPLYGLFTLVVFLGALIVTFPDDRLKQILVVQAERVLNAGKRVSAGDRVWEVQIAELDLWWLSGIELHNVKLKEKWTEEQQTEADEEAAEGAPIRTPLTITIPRVAARASLLKSITNLGLGAVFDVDFDEGGMVTGDVAVTSEATTIDADVEDLDIFKASILQSVTGVPGFGTLNGDITLAIDPKTGMVSEGNVDLKGRKLTVGPATVKTEMLPSMAYLEVPQTNFGNLVIKASIGGKPGKPTELTFEEFEANGRDVRMQVWGDVDLRRNAALSRSNVDLRLQFDEGFVKENSLTPLLNLQLFRSGKSSDNWYGITLKGTLSKLRPKGSVLAARGPRKKAGGGADAGAPKEDSDPKKPRRRNIRKKK